MDTSPQPARSADADPAAAANLSSAINKLWIRFLPEILQRVDVLDAGAAACAANQLTDRERDAAHSAAHKLAGTLGTFNLARGTELARELELLFAENQKLDASVSARIAEVANQLRILIDNRK